MLVLSRRVGENICIGNDVVVTVVSTCGNRVRVGVAAPTGILVDRREIRLRKLREHEEPCVPVSIAQRPRQSKKTSTARDK